ncbi:uncharacterized protein LOC113469990 [Diaphorina citri]|uniref:Uncharacterized protein LOC113469990 n=1 Tax=Diaphorina citri TaxID=121845 RepID=A0A3Q0J5Z9_DIACI|nr:uncharacterized protein LOC113469990 [Diaphorina citri]XP_026683905.1 uncharacterized protein LOC113469990 [Diaphorina citri]
MKLAHHLDVSFCLILITVETYLIPMTTSLGTTQPQRKSYNESVAELARLNKKLYERISRLEALCKNLRFLKRLSRHFQQRVNAINDRNRETSLEVHNVPALTWDEQYEIAKKLGLQLFGSYDDRDITGIRSFFTYKDSTFRHLIIQFRSQTIKNKWFTTFINLVRAKGFTYIKYFPGMNITLYDGTEMRGITIVDHISKYKASVLKVAQGKKPVASIQ